MPSVLPQQVDRRALVERLAAPFNTPEFRAAQLARLDALTDPRDREHTAAQAHQHNNRSG